MEYLDSEVLALKVEIAELKLFKLRFAKALQSWIDKQGHDQCHYYPDIFRELCGLCGIGISTPSLPPRHEFEKGCKRYQDEIYRDTEEDRKKSADRMEKSIQTIMDDQKRMQDIMEDRRRRRRNQT